MDDLHYPLPQDDAKTIELAIQKIRYDVTENLYIFKNGKQKRRFKGDVNFVSLSNKYAFELKDGTLVHNHPSGSSFSPQDIQIAIQHNVKDFYLVTPNYLFYIKRPTKGWNIDFNSELIEEQLNALQTLALQLIENEIVKNQMSIYEKEIEFFHYLWILFFDVHEIYYQKREI
ncbi:hypothetical protein [Emticicia agri]|uniref:RadC-like JAB domain-containing protein n=1 Tax=Emticicia agri TaxID=2492393 RepID=A0A4Q5LTV0_9BACT|nr:hypothetical protein [Emticicia agri]RYU92863.1 hypothetical protein EWM59_25005 [Emticicia agri]